MMSVLLGLVYGPGDLSPVHEMLVQYLRGKLLLVPRQTESIAVPSGNDTIDRSHRDAPEFVSLPTIASRCKRHLPRR